MKKKKITAILNRFTTTSQTEEDLKCINSRSISASTDNYPSDPLISEQNKPLFVVRASGQDPSNVTKQDIDRVLSRGTLVTGGLDFEVNIKEGARVMLTTNTDTADRLINGQMETVAKIHLDRVT